MIKAQELIDETIWWEEMKKKVREQDAKEAEQKVIERIVWKRD